MHNSRLACASAQANFSSFVRKPTAVDTGRNFCENMEFLPNNYLLDIPDGCFPLSTDSMALGHFVRLKKNSRVMDLGSGCGTLGILLCAKSASIFVTGVEYSETAHIAALQNIHRNNLSPRMKSQLLDLRQVPQVFPAGSFDLCVSNPPYFTGGPASLAHPTARRNDFCTSAELMEAAGWVLKFGGDFFLVQKPEFLGELIAQGSMQNLTVKHLCLLRHSPSSPVSLVLLQFRKGGKPGMQLEEWTLRNAAGDPTPIYREIYHI